MYTEKEYKKVLAFLTYSMFKEDGSRTKFARKYNIKNYKDFYAFFKELKSDFKSDREGFAFGKMRDMAKSYVGRVWPKMPGENKETKIFNSWSYLLEVVGFILDDLKTLRIALERMDKEHEKKSKSK